MSTSRGNTAPRITSRKIVRGETAHTATIVLEGKLSDLSGQAAGDWKLGTKCTVLGLDDLEVAQSELQTRPGGLGTLTVTATRPTRHGEGGGGGGGASPISTSLFHVEVDFTTITKPLAEHPAFSELDDIAWAAIHRWEALAGNSLYSGRYAAFQVPTYIGANKADGPDPSADADWADLLEQGERALEYAKRKIKGIEEYMVQVPVIRKTSSESAKVIVDSHVGQRETPDTATGIEGAYAWLKTTDRWSRDGRRGKWTHEEEWTGFDRLDPLLYP